MVVDDVPDADKVLVGKASAWKGPSTAAHLRKLQSIAVHTGAFNFI